MTLNEAAAILKERDAMNARREAAAMFEQEDPLSLLDECPHHTQTDWSAPEYGPGWVCPYGCGAFVADGPDDGPR